MDSPSFSAALTLDARPESCMLRLLSPLSKERKLAIEVALSPCLTLVCLSILELDIDVLLCSYMMLSTAFDVTRTSSGIRVLPQHICSVHVQVSRHVVNCQLTLFIWLRNGS